MRIVIFGAGAIGSLLGALLSKQHDVVLIGRQPHVDTIRSKGLTVQGHTRFQGQITAKNSLDDVAKDVDLLLLTVKSYDTLAAMKQARSILSDQTIVLTFQNGLNNIEKIQSVVPKQQILAGVTTHGVVFHEPGVIHHTGVGRTLIGEFDGSETKRLKEIQQMFNDVGFPVELSKNIIEDIWVKAIINSSINPLTAIFKCKNGYLKENPVLFHLMSSICEESVAVAASVGYHFSKTEMVKKTMQVILETSDNFSSMLQSVKRGSRTEIDSINEIIVTLGEKNNVPVILNESLSFIIKKLYS